MRSKVSIAVIIAAVAAAVAAGTATTVALTASGSTSGTLNLPRVAWEGGPSYWAQFPLAKAAGWTNPKFFPIGMWFDGVSSVAEARLDKSYGINTYIGEPPSTNYGFFAGADSFVLNTLSNTPRSGKAQPGLFLADEPDGQSGSSAAALRHIQQLVAAAPKTGRFDYINYSSTLINGSEPQVNKANFVGMAGAYAGPVSVDKYYYTQPDCTDIRYLIEPIDPGHCRTASSYGATVRALRSRVGATGHLKPVWNFIEDLSGAPDAGHFFAYVQPGQLAGAVLDSIINEARGIVYFNQSYAGTCTGSNVIRQAQDGALPCARPQLAGLKAVDKVIVQLAPVLNTQSYRYTFGPDLDTMLKAYAGNAYIFAELSGAAGSQPGKRTFTLPPGLAKATSVAVVDENRTLQVVNGKFTDNFSHEYTYHIYKVEI
jgi:hypothetical protein